MMTSSEIAALQSAAAVSGMTVTANSVRYVGGVPNPATLTFTDFSTLSATDQAKVNSDTPQYKEVTLNFGWNDAASASHTMAMTTIISPLAISGDDTLDTKDLAGAGVTTPLVRTKQPSAPGVIPISIGDPNTDTA